MKPKRILLLMVTSMVAVGFVDDRLHFVETALADEELERRASWQFPAYDSVVAQIETWAESATLKPSDRESVETIWNQPLDDGSALLQQVIETLALGEPQVAEILSSFGSHNPTTLPSLDWVADEEHPAFVRDHARLYLGKWFTMNEMYNEALEILDPLNTEHVVDPASLLFYRSAAQYRLRQKEEGLATLAKLFEHRDRLPQRYAKLAELMEADLQNLEPDSLDEIARLMESVRARLGLGRAGTRVRTEEEEIIKKLEKIIEEKEQQRQQQMAQSSGTPQGNQSSNPAQDSLPAQARGNGEVDPKKVAENTDWGNLPPREREEALQSLGKDYPSHYREVIEEYFRKLAREEIEN